MNRDRCEVLAISDFLNPIPNLTLPDIRISTGILQNKVC